MRIVEPNPRPLEHGSHHCSLSPVLCAIVFAGLQWSAQMLVIAPTNGRAEFRRITAGYGRGCLYISQKKKRRTGGRLAR
jgi:hypothetical protein